jgi:fibronectin-binding autotransporter adhesin
MKCMKRLVRKWCIASERSGKATEGSRPLPAGSGLGCVRHSGVLLSAAVVLCCGLRSYGADVVNSGFELPVYAAGGWAGLATDGEAGGWSFTAGGVARNGSPWVTTAPEGAQTAWLQNNSAMWQSVTFPASGTYRVSFMAANRPNYNANNLSVQIGGVTIGSLAYTQINNGAAFQSFSFVSGPVPMGTHELRFVGATPGGDTASAIDAVTVEFESAVLHWNPDPLSDDWGSVVWATNSGAIPSKNWSDGHVAAFDQAGVYTVTNNSARSAVSLNVEAGAVTFAGTGGVASDLITITAGATLSGAGERYLKQGSTLLTVDGTLDCTALDDPSRTVSLAGGSGLIVLGSNLTVAGGSTFAGSMSGVGGVTKTGGETLRINNSFTGPLNVQSGRLILENAAAGDVAVAANAALVFTDPAHLVSALTDASNDFDGTAQIGIFNAGALTNPNLTGTDFDSLRFLKMGGGALTLSTAAALSNVTGGVIVAAGELKLSAVNAVNASTPITVENGGRLTLAYGPTLNISHPLTLSGNYDNNDGNGSLYINVNGGNASLNAPLALTGDTKIRAYSAGTTVHFNEGIGGAGNLLIGGGGGHATHLQTFNFNAPSTFAGNVTLKNDAGSNAQFNWGVDDAMPAASVLMLGGPNWNSTYARIDLKGFDQQTAGIANGAVLGAVRTINNSAGTASTLGMNVASADITYSGALSGAINLVKSGHGSQRLTGSGAAHSGAVTVQQGTLFVGPNTLPNAAITVLNSARLIPNSDGVTTVAHTTLTGIGDRGALYFEGGNDTWNGDITLNGYARIGSYGGGVMTKTLNGAIDGSGTLNLWAGGGGNTHENVYVLSGESSFDGPMQMDAIFGACLTVKLSGGDNRLPAEVTAVFNPNWNLAFCRLDLAGTAAQRVGSLVSAGNAARGRAVINSVAATTSTLTINKVGGSSVFEGVIGASGPCLSAGAVNLVKEGGGAQIFRKGSVFTWNNNLTGTNAVNANVAVNGGAVGFSGTDMLGGAYAVTVGAGGALLAPSKATLDALRADPRFTIDAASAVGLYDTWDLTAADPARMFYYSGNATLTTDNTAALPNGLILAGGNVQIGIDGAGGDAVFGPAGAPLILNGTSIKNNDNNPVLSAARIITVNAGGVAFTAGWSKELLVQSQLTGAGGVNINCDSGFVVLSNAGNDYAGDTTIATQWAGYFGATGRLKLGASEVIPHGAGKGDLVLNSGATLEMNGFSETVNALNSSAANALITNSSQTPSVLTVGANSATGSYSGSISGAITLVKTGAGVQRLTASCAHSGKTVAAAGTLALEAGCTLASEIVEVHRDARLTLAAAGVFGGAASTTRLFAGVNKSSQGQQAQIEIPSGVNVTTFYFAIDGVFKPAGTWGATGSGADFEDDSIFSGGGILTVLATGPASGTVIMLR